MLFESFLREAVSKGKLEIIGSKVFPSDSFYVTEYNDQPYLAVNFTEVKDMKKYFPRTWEEIEDLTEGELDPDGFTFVAFIGVESVGVSFYTTDNMNVVTKAESKPDGSDANSAAVKLIARLKIEERVKEIQSKMAELDDVKEEAVKFDESADNVVTASILVDDVRISDTDHLEKKLAGMLELPVKAIDIFVRGNRIRANIDVPPTMNIDGDTVEQALRDLVEK